ncbi:MAG TPA: HAD hydrolase family protein [Chloroflexota bacterium]|nr:HAD hydrolase family protein [Chloroflexota bacterium]
MYAASPRLLLALDCDGTLLDPAGQITPRVRHAVRAAAAEGALVTLATGRRLQGARAYAEALDLRTPLVLQDGATVQDPLTGRLLHTDPLPPELIVRLVDLSLDYGLHPVLQRITSEPAGDTIHVLDTVDGDPTMVTYLSSRTPVQRGDRTALLAAAPIARFQAMGAEEPARRLYTHVRARVEELCCRALLSAPLSYAAFPFWAVLVSNGGCSKASAVAALARQNGLTLRACAAIGDAENDVELLEHVRAAGGLAIAMGQAPPEVKEAASVVVPSNGEDGVAVAIERHVLPLLKAVRITGIT